MKTLTLEKKHFNSENFYIGKHDLSDFEGNVEISKKVGVARFEAIKVSGYLKGTSIVSNKGIETGEFLEATWCIKAPGDIKAGGNIINSCIPEKTSDIIRLAIADLEQAEKKRPVQG